LTTAYLEKVAVVSCFGHRYYTR